jgi:dynein intermediate chain 3, axonemal
MPEPAPPGICPLFLRGVTAEKYGFKIGEGVMDLVDHKILIKEDVMKEIQGLGVMSDFQPAQKQIEMCPGEDILFVIDKESKYGEVFLLCFTQESRDEFMNRALEAQAAIEAQKRAEEEAEQAKIAAAYARANVVYEDKPIEPRPWVSDSSTATMEEVESMTNVPVRERIKIEITRPKRYTGQPTKFLGRDAAVSGIMEFKAFKDPNFMPIAEASMGIQAAPTLSNMTAQTTWHRSVNKAVQHETLTTKVDIEANRIELCQFLESATLLVELALQQNETLDIFHETFAMAGEEDGEVGDQAENDLRELKNFADPNYSQGRALTCIQWVPKVQGMVAVSCVRNITFDQRSAIAGQTNNSYILVWDFRQLVRPQMIMQSPFEVLAFDFNKDKPGICAGGLISGQVGLWDISKNMAALSKMKGGDDDEQENKIVAPMLLSHVDYSHKRPVTDLFWLPADTQFNFRGQLVREEFLTEEQFQFATVSGDGHIMVWDTRYEKIAADELRHIGRTKHIPMEKMTAKVDNPKAFFAPILSAHIKRSDGVEELSLNQTACAGLLKRAVTARSTLSGDARSRIMLSTEEGDLLTVDLCAPKEGGDSAPKKDDDEDGDAPAGKEYVKWVAPIKHTRPCVCLQFSPHLPDIVLSVSDWRFHIWKVGVDRPLFISPMSHTYMTCGAWSPTRPALVYIALADGEIHAWDFTDSSYRPSIEFKATPNKITTMQFMPGSSRHQLLALGIDVGTLQVFEIPRNLVRPVHNEEGLMTKFVERELMTMEYLSEYKAEAVDVDSMNNAMSRPMTALDVEEPEEVVDPHEKHKQKLKAKQDEFDAFELMEMQFIEELGLSEVPVFAQKHLATIAAKAPAD